MKTTDTEAKQRFQDKLVSFIVSKRITLLILIGIVAAGFIGLLIYSEIDNRINMHATTLVEQVQVKYQNWLEEEDMEKKILLENEILSSIESIINEFPNKYAGQRALYLRGLIYFNNKDWQKAYDDFIIINETFDPSYLTSLAMFMAAVSQEKLGNKELAIEAYLNIYENTSTMPLISNVIFSIGRLYDSQEDYTEALEYYNILKADYANSVWTKYAINRIIQLKAQGKL